MTLFLLYSIIAAGCLGGAAYCLVNNHPAFPGLAPTHWEGAEAWNLENFGKWLWQLLIAIVLGVAAAFTVPVLLHATSSNLVSELVKPSSPAAAPAPVDHSVPRAAAPSSFSSDWYVFFGFCVLAAYSAQRFLQAMLNRVLQELEQQKTQVQAAQKTAAAACVDAETAKQLAQELADDVSEPDAIAPRANVAPVVLPAEEERIIEAFQEARRSNRWTRRTTSGLAADTGLTVPMVQEALERLMERGLVNKCSANDRVRWRLTDTGRRWISSAALERPQQVNSTG